MGGSYALKRQILGKSKAIRYLHFSFKYVSWKLRSTMHHGIMNRIISSPWILVHLDLNPSHKQAPVEFMTLNFSSFFLCGEWGVSIEPFPCCYYPIASHKEHVMYFILKTLLTFTPPFSYCLPSLNKDV